MKTAAAQVDAAEAQLSAAEDLLGFTELRADQDGVVHRRRPRPRARWCRPAR